MICHALLPIAVAMRTSPTARSAALRDLEPELLLVVATTHTITMVPLHPQRPSNPRTEKG
jgi:hypothetical protein